MERIHYGGVELTESHIGRMVSRSMPVPNLGTEQVPGRDGYVPTGGELLPGSVTFRLVAKGGEQERRAFAREIAPLVMSREPKRLEFASDGGLWCMAVPVSADFREYVASGVVDVEMRPIDAAMYGEERTVTVPSGGSASFVVGGTYPTQPKASANAVRSPNSLVWGLRLDGGAFVHVATGNSSARAVAIDCAARTCTVAGAQTIPTLDSDWLSMAPGEHVLAMDNGTGAATVSFVERWLV